MREPPPSFLRDGFRRGAPTPRFGMGRRVRFLETAVERLRGVDGVIERILEPGPDETSAAAPPPRYRVRMALSALGLAGPESPDTLDVEADEADLAPFFDYSADPAEEKARLERAIAQGRRPLSPTAGAGWSAAVPEQIPFAAAEAAVRRAWRDPGFAAALVEDAPAALGREAGWAARLIVFAQTPEERHRLVWLGAGRHALAPPPDPSRPCRNHDVAGARQRYLVLPLPPEDDQGVDSDAEGVVTPEMLTGAA